MKSKGILLKVNVLVCVLLLATFFIITYISHQFNDRVFLENSENVAQLTSEDIFYQINAIFTKPINISLTMAHDNLLKNFLKNERDIDEDSIFLDEMRDYLAAYKNKYDYESVFLVSTKTDRYYNFNGLDRVLYEENPENYWYYDFLKSDEEYNLNIDNDEAANNEITVFINCKIRANDGSTMGIVGVGFRVDNLQKLLAEHENIFGVTAMLVDNNDVIQISSSKTGFLNEKFFENSYYSQRKDEILSSRDENIVDSFWYRENNEEIFVVNRYINILSWHLIIENDTSEYRQELHRDFIKRFGIVLFMCVVIMYLISVLIKKENEKIALISIQKEKERGIVFREATGQLYEKINEVNITHNQAADENTQRYFESLGAAHGATYDEALRIIAQKEIREDFRRGYLDMFLSENVLKAYEKGIRNLSYELITKGDGESYHWVRITGRIFYWKEDNAIRMFSFRENIDDEKSYMDKMQSVIKRDPMTGLLNKIATQNAVAQCLEENTDKTYAMWIFDIDKFKDINDKYGHLTGDEIIIKFCGILKEQFSDEDIVGRIGGDEYLVLMQIHDVAEIKDKAKSVIKALNGEYRCGEGNIKVTTSVGIAIANKEDTDFALIYKCADIALYDAKKKGRSRYSIYDK